jgi:hypothetical protein
LSATGAREKRRPPRIVGPTDRRSGHGSWSGHDRRQKRWAPSTRSRDGGRALSATTTMPTSHRSLRHIHVSAPAGPGRLSRAIGTSLDRAPGPTAGAAPVGIGVVAQPVPQLSAARRADRPRREVWAGADGAHGIERGTSLASRERPIMRMARPAVLPKPVGEYEVLRVPDAQNGSHQAWCGPDDVAHTPCVATGTRDLEAALVVARRRRFLRSPGKRLPPRCPALGRRRGTVIADLVEVELGQAACGAAVPGEGGTDEGERRRQKRP